MVFEHVYQSGRFENKKQKWRETVNGILCGKIEIAHIGRDGEKKRKKKKHEKCSAEE